MAVTIGAYTFASSDYDPDRDLLELAVADDWGGSAFFDGPENATWLRRGRHVTCVFVYEAGKKLNRDGVLYVTTPEGERVTAQGVTEVVHVGYVG
ncbi:MAG: hypothetical protein MSC31_13720 [Solirubrobacteraceae bacterium MAG38_C4-C5]|nr:hypothetical protein [Candidatus Siliceabacter maunaloa]